MYQDQDTLSRSINCVAMNSQVCFHRQPLSNHVNCVGALQDLWALWEALIRIGEVPNCCQWPSQSVLWIVYISVIYWEHSTTVCALMVGRTCLRLALPCPPPLALIHDTHGIIGVIKTISKTSSEYCVTELALQH